jgi:23S rRNA (cytosine1962-C5)-methyltransferase
MVDVVDHRGRFLARGDYNPASSLAVRVMGRDRAEAIDAVFLRRRISEAVAWRRTFYATGDCCRLVFGEGDRLPGLTVDRYGPVLVIQISTLGMDRRREAIVAALEDTLHPRGIYERSDLPVRAREGLEPRTGALAGEVPETLEVVIDDLRFLVHPRESQKTGLYLDHRINRRLVRTLAGGRRVLDVFCNSGAFALYAAGGGCARATGVEISAECLADARRNALANGADGRCDWIEGNAFDTLRALEKRGETYDLIVLDPPAFTKSAAAVAAAIRGYKEINLRAFRLAAPGAILVTASCSFHLGPEEFLQVVRDAAADARRDAILIGLHGQAPDHPVHLAVPESRYLKCAFLLVR